MSRQTTTCDLTEASDPISAAPTSVANEAESPVLGTAQHSALTVGCNMLHARPVLLSEAQERTREDPF